MKDQKGISTLFVAIIIIMILVIIFGGFFAWQYFFVKPQPQTNKTASVITEKDLLGYWKIGDAEPIAFCDYDSNSGFGQYISYLHERPAEGGIWQLDKTGKLTIQYDIPGEKPIVINSVTRTGNTLTLNGAPEFNGSYTLVTACDGEPVIVNNQTSNQTAGWKTYASNSLGISINYPSSWTYQEYSCNIDGVAFCLQKSGVKGCGQTCSMNSPSAPIYFVIDMWNNSKDKQKSFSLKDTKYQDIYNQMLSSFKSDPTAGWKTYINSDYGFQMQYPNGWSANEAYTNGGIMVTLSSSNKKIVAEVDSKVLGGAQNPPSCNTASGSDIYYKNINGVTFAVVDMSRLLSGNVSTSATQYCVLKDGGAYKIIPQIQYGNTGRVDVNNDAILNQIISTFKLTK